MLILAEGTISPHTDNAERAGVPAWLGPMVDAGFMQDGWINRAGDHVWLLLASPDLATAVERLADLPVVRSGAVHFTTTEVTAARFV